MHHASHFSALKWLCNCFDGIIHFDCPVPIYKIRLGLLTARNNLFFVTARYAVIFWGTLRPHCHCDTVATVHYYYLKQLFGAILRIGEQINVTDWYASMMYAN